jgi:hypothetical protein
MMRPLKGCVRNTPLFIPAEEIIDSFGATGLGLHRAFILENVDADRAGGAALVFDGSGIADLNRDGRGRSGRGFPRSPGATGTSTENESTKCS